MLTTAVTASTASGLGIPETLGTGISAAVGASFISTAISIAVVVVVVFAVMIATGEISVDAFAGFWGIREVKREKPQPNVEVRVFLPPNASDSHSQPTARSVKHTEIEVKGKGLPVGPEPTSSKTPIVGTSTMAQSPNATVLPAALSAQMAPPSPGNPREMAPLDPIRVEHTPEKILSEALAVALRSMDFGTKVDTKVMAALGSTHIVVTQP